MQGLQSTRWNSRELGRNWKPVSCSFIYCLLILCLYYQTVNSRKLIDCRRDADIVMSGLLRSTCVVLAWSLKLKGVAFAPKQQGEFWGTLHVWGCSREDIFGQSDLFYLLEDMSWRHLCLMSFVWDFAVFELLAQDVYQFCNLPEPILRRSAYNSATFPRWQHCLIVTEKL